MNNANQSMTSISFNLPGAAIAHVEAYAAGGFPDKVTPSEALSRILRDHSLLGAVAAGQGLTVTDLCTRLATGALVVSQPSVTAEV